MKTTINKTITVLERLSNKYKNINSNLLNMTFSEEEASTINTSLNNILALFGNNGTAEADLVTLGILPKQISEYTTDDIGTSVLIPYTDESGIIQGPIEFEIVGINHHIDINNPDKPTITLMTKNILRSAVFDASEENNPLYDDNYGGLARAESGNGRWSVSNIRQWLNSEGKANEWFIPQHEYDAQPSNNIPYKNGAYSDEAGFLTGFSSDIKQHLATIKNKTILCNQDKLLLNKDFEETEDKVFLPSYTEMGYGNLDSNNPEGYHLSYRFTNFTSRYKNSIYFMRSPDMTNTGGVLTVSDEQDYGEYFCDTPCMAHGITPLIVLY